ncbi:hypothetical protein DK419_14540 [Methylobacterium terrae]|uniref:Uncharacterized protein n=2 Tax=Methylobacterium terrae TaxID=2202827 RepID=A0A2U8WQ98_9HYPH|nr:hypothetical protein DK419_14540 [Methylobacterium terrae]
MVAAADDTAATEMVMPLAALPRRLATLAARTGLVPTDDSGRNAARASSCPRKGRGSRPGTTLIPIASDP